MLRPEIPGRVALHMTQVPPLTRPDRLSTRRADDLARRDHRPPHQASLPMAVAVHPVVTNPGPVTAQRRAVTLMPRHRPVAATAETTNPSRQNQVTLPPPRPPTRRLKPANRR